ncbi:MAG: pyridoxal phosphate-dependent aminotransferase [Patescibacteria group bacterium]
MRFSKHGTITPSAILAINSLALAKKKQGIRVYNLSAGEPFIATHPAVRETAEEAMRGGKTQYPPVEGIPELRQAVSAWMNRKYQSEFQTEHVLVSCGGKSALYLSCQALINPDDEVLIPTPAWVSYGAIVKLCGGVPVFVGTRETGNWKLSARGGSALGGEIEEIENLKNICSSKTKMLILNNASNPTGVLYTKEEIREILDFAKKKNLIVISDEVYSGLVYDGREYVSCASFPEFQDSVVVIQSCSKHFAMTGWRVGFALGSRELIDAVVALQGQETSGTSSISQWAAVGAFAHADEIQEIVRGTMQTRRDVFVQALSDQFGAHITPPLSALYSFLPLSSFGVSDTDDVLFCRRTLEEANVAMVPGSAFGAPGYVRCSFGAEEKEITEGIKTLAAYCKK